MTRAPMDNISSRYKAVEERNGSLGHCRLIVELNDDRQVDHQPQNVCRVHLSLAAESGNAAEDHDTVNSVLIAKDIEHFLRNPIRKLPRTLMLSVAYGKSRP
jgi:hypothetical protein